MTGRHIALLSRLSLQDFEAVEHVSNLNSSLSEFGPLSKLLPCVDVGVVSAFEGSLQLLQLLGCEGGPTATLLPLQRQPWL